MKNRLLVILGFVLLSMGAAASAFSQEASPQATIALEKSVHFLSPNGADAVLAPGIYSAKPEGDKAIQVTAREGGATTTIQTETGRHEQQISTPELVAASSDEDVIHIVLLMPDGKTLDAVGTLSGVRTRGPMFVPLEPRQLAGAMMMQRRFGRMPVEGAGPGGGVVPGGGLVPGGGGIPGGPQIGTQLPRQLQTQPGLEKTAPFPAPSGPQAEVTTPMELVVVPIVGLQLTRWALKPELPPSIPPNSEVLLFIHGMDSRAEEADDITNALFKAMPATRPIPPPVWPPIAANRSNVQFTNCENPAGGCPEPCDHLDDFSNGQRKAVVPFDIVNGTPTRIYFGVPPVIPPQVLDTAPPPGTVINVPAAHNIGMNEGRLRPDLRAAAAAAQPKESLKQAAARFAMGDTVMGNAFADLSVTGHKSFAAFRHEPPGEAFCQSVGGSHMQNGCRTALDRAYRVANFLRTGQRGDTPELKKAKIAERYALGWIAVSGEDDSPHRPVNVPSSDFPQFDLVVPVEAPLGPPPGIVNVHTRYTIAQSQTSGRNLVVISLDLPTSGYADNLDYNLISSLGLIGGPKWTPLPIPIPVPTGIEVIIPGLPPAMPPILPPGFIIPPGVPLPDFQASGNTPLLDFIETFIVNFAVTLDRTVPFKNNIKAVMGGSLGGNMTFRLGRRPNTPWLPNFIVWSPASIWTSLGAGPDLFKHYGVRKGWENANGAMENAKSAMKALTAGDRASFFQSWDKAIVPVVIPRAQSGTWTSDFYRCKESSVAGARLDRQETYDAMFLAWHWRLGTEQLLYSHSNRDARGQPLYRSNTKPMLLACGLEDRVPWNDICPATQTTASDMLTPGKALFLGQTGHSLDNERRTFFAHEIIQFLGL